MSEETIFAHALSLSDPAQRRAYLDRACAGDPALRREVESLLEAHEGDSGFLRRPAVEQVAPGAATEALASDATPDRPERTRTEGGAPGDEDLPFLAPSDEPGSLGRFLHYEVLEVLGRGGFGTVLKAFDQRLHRVVAIKLLASQLASSGTARRRFLREARAAAAVRNDHVVNIYAVDEAPTPYLVMECVVGQTLQQKLDRAGALELREVLRIGAQVAEGLAAAHRQGLVHRDIKPANILLENGVERVKITDFGLARAADDASISQSGVVSGTPMYMSPEQAQGEPVDHRSDLFSLGSVLYALCAGRPPFRAAGAMAVLKRVCEETPRPIADSNPEAPGWLCDIVSRLHAKKPADRFQSAKEVAELLEQHLAHLQQPTRVPMPAPAKARSESSPPRADAARGRRPWRFAAAAFLLLLLAGLAAVLFLHPAGDQAGYLLLEGVAPGTAVDFDPEGSPWRVVANEEGLGVVRAAPGWEVVSQEKSPAGPEGTDVLIKLRAGDHTVRITGADGSGVTERVTVTAGQRAVLRLPPGPRRAGAGEGFTALFNGRDLTGWKPHPRQPGTWGVADGVLVGSGGPGHLYSARGDYENFHLRVEAAVSEGGAADVYVRASTDLPGAPPSHLHPAGYAVELGKGGPGSISFRNPQDNAALGTPSSAAVDPGEWFTLEVIADGNRLLTKVNGVVAADREESLGAYKRGFIALQVWGAETVVKLRRIEVKELPPPDRYNPAGSLEPGPGEVRRFVGHTRPVVGVALSRDGTRALSGGHDGTVRLWDVATGKELLRMNEGGAKCESVALLPDGAFALSGHLDGVIRLWDLRDGKEVRRFEGHTGGVRALALSGDGKRLLSGGSHGDRTARVWDVGTGEELRRLGGHAGTVWGAALSPDGARALTGDSDFDSPGEVRIRYWDVGSGKELGVYAGHQTWVSGLAFLPGGRRALSAGLGDPEVRRWDLDRGEGLGGFAPPSHGVHGLAVSEDGRRAVTCGGDHTVRLWDVETGKELHRFEGHGATVFSVAVSSDGRYALSGGGDVNDPQPTDFSLRLWQLPDPAGK